MRRTLAAPLFVTAVVLGGSFGLPSGAAAQASIGQASPEQTPDAPGSAVTFGELHLVGGVPTELLVRIGPDRRGTVVVSTPAGSVTVHAGSAARAWGAASEDGLFVALVGASATVEVVYVSVRGGRPALGRRSSVRRLAGAERAPVGAYVAARPDGFALIWQEASTTDGNAAYATYLSRYDPAGRPVAAAEVVNAVWPLADVVYEPAQRRYYFLLYYGSAAGTRLCGVHIDEGSSSNIEHPYWVSPVGAMEARLYLDGDRVRALYRGGARGELLQESDVTGGQWGVEPAPPRSHGALAPNDAFGARVGDDGLEVARRAIPQR